MKLRTEIESFQSQIPIGCRDSIFIIGSCFADNIGTWLNNMWLSVCLNPFGVLYNPMSIASGILSLANKKKFSVTDLVQGQDGLFYSFSHHGKFTSQSAEELVNMLNDNQWKAANALIEAKHVLVTLGTAWVYEREGEVVANCHKFPSKDFLRRKLSINEIISAWSDILARLEDTHFIFTVSPIRHVRDGLHSNALSKSTLLIAIDELCQLFPNRVEYFPAYELLIDDLRDYRFYAEDLIHPSTTAIEIIKEYFTQSCLDKECQEYVKEIQPLIKALQHRPLHPSNEEYRTFIDKTNQNILSVKKKYLK